MAATISASTASGSWTGITFDAMSAARTQENAPRLDDQRLDAFANTDWSELTQFVQLVATNYSIGFQPALVLVQHGLRALQNRSALPSSATYVP